jgi:hypothetical protein
MKFNIKQRRGRNLSEIGEEVGAIRLQGRGQIVFSSFFVWFLVVVDAVEVFEVLDVPELDVVVVRAAGDELARVADVHGFDSERVLTNDSEDSTRNQVHRANDTWRSEEDCEVTIIGDLEDFLPSSPAVIAMRSVMGIIMEIGERGPLKASLW